MPWNCAFSTFTAATFGAPRALVARISTRVEGAEAAAPAAGAKPAASDAMSSGCASLAGADAAAVATPRAGADSQSSAFNAAHNCSTRATPMPTTTLSAPLPASAALRSGKVMPYSFQRRSLFCPSATEPLTNTVRETPAAKLPAIAPNCSVGVATASIGASTGSRSTTAITRS